MVDELCMSEALLAGAKEVFETMIFMDLCECNDPERNIEGDSLLGTITFKGNLEGCLGICCSTGCVKAIAANMLGTEPGEQISEEDMCDAIGEIANMIMGSVKSRIEEPVGRIEVSIPSVVSGRRLENSLGEGACRILTKVDLAEEFVAEFSLLYREGS